MGKNVVINFDAETAKRYKESLELAKPIFRKIKQRQPKD